MSNERLRTGRSAEALVASYLVRQGYEILDRNVRVGRLELDLVAKRGDLIIVCEVRSRSSGRFGPAVATITQEKIRRIRRATRLFLARHGVWPREVRLDAAAVTFTGNAEPRIDYFENAL